MTAVIDASIVVKWFVEEDGADEARCLQDDLLFAPDLIVAETMNVLWKKVRSDGFGAADVALAVEVIRRADLVIEPGLELASRAFDSGHGLNHAVYDCFYLALAERRGLPFISADEKLGRKLLERPTITSARVVSLPEHISNRRNIHE